MQGPTPEIIKLASAIAEAAGDLPASAARIVQLLRQLAASSTAYAALAVMSLLWPAPSARPTTRQNAIVGLLAKVLPAGEKRRHVPPEIQSAAAAVVNDVMRSMPAEDLPNLDQMSRFYLGSNMGAPSSDRLPSAPAGVHLLGLLASQPNGYLREAAVRQLAFGRTGEELPYLLWRTVDWVAQVRAPAIDGVRARLRPEAADAFARLLPLIERMDGITRTLDQLWLSKDIRTLLLAESGLAALTAVLRTGRPIERLAACRLLDRIEPAPPLPILQLAAADTDPHVRTWALRWAARARPTQPEAADALVRRFTRDRYARLRLQALYQIVAADREAATEFLREAVMDRVAFIQHAARHYLRANGDNQDFAAHYRQNLSIGGKDALSAIVGLAATGTSADWKLMQPFLAERPALARPALKAMAKFDADACRGDVFECLIDTRLGLRRDALMLLTAKRLDAGDASALESLWSRATDRLTRRTVAAAMLRLPPWPSLAALLQAAVADSDGADEEAIAALGKWRPEHRAFYAPLPPDAETRAKIDERLAGAVRSIPPELRARLEAALSVR